MLYLTALLFVSGLLDLPFFVGFSVILSFIIIKD